MSSLVMWCDIPVTDLDRAVAFYEKVLGVKIEEDSFLGSDIGIIPHANGEPGGCLFKSRIEKPNPHGALIYFNCEGRLKEAEKAVVKNGGRILQEAESMEPQGHRVLVQDTEGNHIALYSKSAS